MVSSLETVEEPRVVTVGKRPFEHLQLTMPNVCHTRTTVHPTNEMSLSRCYVKTKFYSYKTRHYVINKSVCMSMFYLACASPVLLQKLQIRQGIPPST
jgi:hypothetical protein